MKLDFGKHHDRTLESLVATEPDYLVWMLGLETPSPRVVELRGEARRLIRLVNEAPWAVSCRCGDRPNHAEVRWNGVVLLGLRPVCRSCRDATRRAITRYGEAVAEGGTKGERRELAREFARLKGLRPRGRAETFFRSLVAAASSEEHITGEAGGRS